MARNHTTAQKKARDSQHHCAYCGHKLYDTGRFKRTIDHFYPLSIDSLLNRGWNKFTICHRCNQMKGQLMPMQYVKKLQKELRTVSNTTDYFKDIQDSIQTIKAIHVELIHHFHLRDIL